MIEALGWGALAASSLIIGGLLGLRARLARPRRRARAGLRRRRADQRGELRPVRGRARDRPRVRGRGRTGRRCADVLRARPLVERLAQARLARARRAARRHPRAGRARDRDRGRRGRERRACWPRSSSRTCRRRSARRPTCAPAAGGRAEIRLLWIVVAAVCTVASVAGYAIADAAGGDLRAAINGFAAGALLVMLVDSMIPEADAQGGRSAGLVTVLGFAVAAGLA